MRYLLLLLTLPFLLGASAGPQVLDDLGQRRFARGPWVSSYESDETFALACDMTSDTCSDGRKISTTRSTPVPCEVAPGQWEMVPEDTGCYSVRGLESWRENTSYLAYGAELDNPAWSGVQGGTVEVLPDGYRIHPAPGSANSGVTQSGLAPISPGGETRTLACIVRTHRPTYIRYWLGGSQSWSFPAVDTGGRWEVLSATREIPDTSGPSVRIGNGPASEDPVPFDVAGCWLTRTSTPGRACWGGAAPVTCAADRHTISTEGWPTESGEICVVASITERLPTAPQYFFDGRIASSSVAARLFISSRSDAPLVLGYGPDQVVVTSALEWEEAKGYSICVRRDAVSGTVSLLRNGVVVGAASAPPLPWLESVHLGSAFSASVSQFLDGSISSLRIRSAE